MGKNPVWISIYKKDIESNETKNAEFFRINSLNRVSEIISLNCVILYSCSVYAIMRRIKLIKRTIITTITILKCSVALRGKKKHIFIENMQINTIIM